MSNSPIISELKENIKSSKRVTLHEITNYITMLLSLYEEMQKTNETILGKLNDQNEMIKIIVSEFNDLKACTLSLKKVEDNPFIFAGRMLIAFFDRKNRPTIIVVLLLIVIIVYVIIDIANNPLAFEAFKTIFMINK